MSKPASQLPPRLPARYEIRIREPIQERWLPWFDELEITSTDTGGTLLTGSITDQAALHGILARIHDLHLTLISVNRVAEDGV